MSSVFLTNDDFCSLNVVFQTDGISPPPQQNVKEKIPELRVEDDTYRGASSHPNGREPRSPNQQATAQMFYSPDNKYSGQMKVYREAQV